MQQISTQMNPPARLRWLATTVALISIGLFVVSQALTLAQRANDPVSDLRAFYEGAERLRAGLPLYDTVTDFYLKPIQYIYPPPVAFVLLPFPSYTAAWWGWAAVTAICWVAALALMLRELHSGLHERVPPLWQPVLIAALALFTPVQSHFFWGQTQLQLLLLLTGSWLALRRGRDTLAGALLGLAVAIKIFPLLLLLPLLIRRRWRCVAAASLTSVVVLAASYALVGWDQAYVYFFDVMPRHSGSVIEHSTAHTSIRAMLINAGMAAEPANWASLAVRGLVMVAVAYGAWRARDAAVAFAIGMTSLVLVTPVVWEHYFVLVYLPWLVALASANQRELPALVVAYFLLAAATLIYHTPASLLFLAQALPIGGALLLLGVQVRQVMREGAAELRNKGTKEQRNKGTKEQRNRPLTRNP